MTSYIASLPQNLRTWFAGSQSVNILLTGRTGAGKSTLINSVVGDEVAKVGHGLDPQTMIVSPFKTTRNGVEITVWDSPGLQDGTGNEAQYIEDMKRQCKNYDLVLYCTPMTDNRFRNDDILAMEKMTAAFGEKFWTHSVVVITCANQSVSNPDAYKTKLQAFKDKIREVLTDRLMITAEIAEKVPVVPAGYLDGKDPNTCSRKLPDCKDWLSMLWYVSVLRMKDGAKPAMLKASLNRIKSPESITEEDLMKPGHEQPIAYVPAIVKYGSAPSIFIALGLLFGVAVAGPAGAAAGGAAGGAIGGAIDGVIALFST